MELTQIKYFLDAAKTQHITRSAQNLHIAQPALSKSIHKLEDELGVPLFTSKGRNIELTQYGIFLREKLLPIVHSLDVLTDEIAHMTETEKHTVRLSVLAASTLVTEAVIEYKRVHPEINFHVLQNREEEIFDIEITTNLFYSTPANEDKNRFICTEKIFLAVPANGKYKDKKSISLAEVKNEGFISLFGSKQLRNICDKFCRHSGFEPDIIFESDSPYAVKNMIGANMGIGFWPEFTWGTLSGDNVKLLEIEGLPCSRDILITYKPLKTDNTHTEDFFNFLKEHFVNNRT